MARLGQIITEILTLACIAIYQMLLATSKVLHRHFGIETAIYRKWHDKRAKKLQALLDDEHSLYSSYPSF